MPGVHHVWDAELLQGRSLLLHLLYRQCLLVDLVEVLTSSLHELCQRDLFCFGDQHALLLHQEIDPRQEDKLLGRALAQHMRAVLDPLSPSPHPLLLPLILIVALLLDLSLVFEFIIVLLNKSYLYLFLSTFNLAYTRVWKALMPLLEHCLLVEIVMAGVLVVGLDDVLLDAAGDDLLLRRRSSPSVREEEKVWTDSSGLGGSGLLGLFAWRSGDKGGTELHLQLI